MGRFSKGCIVIAQVGLGLMPNNDEMPRRMLVVNSWLLTDLITLNCFRLVVHVSRISGRCLSFRTFLDELGNGGRNKEAVT